MKELCKSIAIVFLSCSAVFLASRVEALTRFTQYLLEEDPLTQVEDVALVVDSASALSPWVIVAVEDGGVARASFQSQGVFEQCAQILKETLGNVEEGRSCSLTEYTRALTSGQSLFFQWMGEIPWVLLGQWSGGFEDISLEHQVESLFLSREGDYLALYYQGGEGYYVCPVVTLDPSRLDAVVAQVEGSPVTFAFEEEEDLSPFTLLWGEELRPVVYTASTAYDEGHKALLEVLGFQASNNAQYSTHEGVAIRSGSDTLRLSYEGLVSYQSEGQSRYTLSHTGMEISLLEQVEGCLHFATRMLQTLETMPELSLTLVEEVGVGLHIGFSAGLDGVPLSYGQGTTVVEFWVEGSEIVEFSLHYRHYRGTEQVSPLLPIGQAKGIGESLGLELGGMFLSYFDQGEDVVIATWVASS